MNYEDHVKESAASAAAIKERREMFSLQDLLRIAQQAWDSTKPEGDPAFYHPDHSVDHRNILLSAVKDIIQTGKSDIARLKAFEEKVLAIVEELKHPKTPAGEATIADQEAAAKAAAPEPEQPIIEGEIVEEPAPPAPTEAEAKGATVVGATGNS